MKIKKWMEKKGLTIDDIVKVFLCMGMLLGVIGFMMYGIVGAWLL
tara:strand:- start:111 stop:245 length:135 start_codon:yes stop_codon:yes gene_type:complete